MPNFEYKQNLNVKDGDVFKALNRLQFLTRSDKATPTHSKANWNFSSWDWNDTFIFLDKTLFFIRRKFYDIWKIDNVRLKDGFFNRQEIKFKLCVLTMKLKVILGYPGSLGVNYSSRKMEKKIKFYVPF